MKDFVKRLIDEHKELLARTEKVEKFLESPQLVASIDAAEQARLRYQYILMTNYLAVLTERLYHQNVNFDGDNYFELVNTDTITKPNDK